MCSVLASLLFSMVLAQTSNPKVYVSPFGDDQDTGLSESAAVETMSRGESSLLRRVAPLFTRLCNITAIAIGRSIWQVGTVVTIEADSGKYRVGQQNIEYPLEIRASPGLDST